MQDHAYAPLRLADLEEEEALVVWLYRHWQDHGPAPEEAETRLAGLLRRDPIHAVLPPIFGFFRELGSDADLHGAGRPTLTEAELRLLDLLAQEGAASGPLESCRAALKAAGIALRPSAAIPRTEAGFLEEAVARRFFPLSSPATA